MGLVDYDSGSESEPETSPPRVAVREAPAAKRTLPGLPSAFESGPKDDPELHQGRSRSRPYVQGDYNAHIYLDLRIPKSLCDLVDELIRKAELLLPSPETLHPFPSLHISLTHPLPLRRSQIPAFQSDLTSALRGLPPFRLSLSSQVRHYQNGKKYGGEGSGGRGFLALRVGAGHTELERLLQHAIHPILDRLHLGKYHENPEFHASVAWYLLREEGGRLTERGLAGLNDEFGKEIIKCQPVGGWGVEYVMFKVGKEVTEIPLGGGA
ncbi:U6 snRNA phosphodiesterase, partial [Tremellales sp. Uapishka_1]